MVTESKQVAVLDSSYVLTYLLPGGADKNVDAFFKDISIKIMYLPPLLEYEVANALAVANHRSRINRNEMKQLPESSQ